MRATLLACLTLLGCGSALAVEVGARFVGRAPMTAPAVYAEWYTKTEACLTVTGDFAAVQWFVADSIFRDDGTEHVGMTTLPDTITMSRSYIDEEWAVRIYMVHHIMQDVRFDALYDVNGRVVCWGE